MAVRQRVAVTRACRDIELGEPQTARLILDGAWLIATADGDAGHHENLVLAMLIDSLALPERIAASEASFSEDEEDWFARIEELGDVARGVLIEVLALTASCDGSLNTPERRFLRRVARALGRPIDLAAVEVSMERLRRGEAPRAPSAQPVLNVPGLATA
jgi:tellurite resistance protein